MVKSTFVKGQQGEDDAAQYLEAQGYTIVTRNWRIVGGEIDLIARQGDEWVFVEVRTRAQKDAAFASIVQRKQATLIRTVEHYLAEHHLEDARWRIDAIAVTRAKPLTIEHVQNIFDW